MLQPLSLTILTMSYYIQNVFYLSAVSSPLTYYLYGMKVNDLYQATNFVCNRHLTLKESCNIQFYDCFQPLTYNSQDCMLKNVALLHLYC